MSRSARRKSRLPVSTNSNNSNKMAVASLPSTYNKFPLRILNKGPEFFRDQVGGHVEQKRPQKSAAERLAESRTQYVKGYSTEIGPHERSTMLMDKKGGKEASKSSPKKKHRTEHRLKLHNLVAPADSPHAKNSNRVLKADSKNCDVNTSDTQNESDDSKSVGKLISQYQGHENHQNSNNINLNNRSRRSPPHIPYKPKRCVSPPIKSSTDDTEDIPFTRISVRQAAKSWENVNVMLEMPSKNGISQKRVNHSSEEIDSVQTSIDGQSTMTSNTQASVKTSSITKVWEKRTADLDGEDQQKESRPPPKVKLIDSTDHEDGLNNRNSCKTSAVKVKLTNAATNKQQTAKLSKPLKVQLINNYNTGKNRGEDGNDSHQNLQRPIRAKVKLVDNQESAKSGTVYVRKDPKRAIRGKVEQVDNFAIGKVTNYSNHVTEIERPRDMNRSERPRDISDRPRDISDRQRDISDKLKDTSDTPRDFSERPREINGNERPRVQSQISTQSETATTDSSISAKVRLLLVQSKESQAAVTNSVTTPTNNVSNDDRNTRGRSKARKAGDKTKNAEDVQGEESKKAKRSPHHHVRSKSSGPLYRMQVGYSQDSGPSVDSARNTTETSSPRSSCPGSPRGIRIRRLQEQLLALCDTEESSSLDSPDSLGEGRFVRSRSSRSYSKESTGEDHGIARRKSAPSRHKESEQHPGERSIVSVKKNVIVGRKDMPVPTLCSPRQNVTDRSKVKERTDMYPDASKRMDVERSQKDTKSSYDSTDRRMASSHETSGDMLHKSSVTLHPSNELVIIETANDFSEKDVFHKEVHMESPSIGDSPSSSIKEKYSRMTTVLLNSTSGVKTEIGAIDTLPISVDVDVEFEGNTSSPTDMTDQGVFDDHRNRRHQYVSKSEPKRLTKNDRHLRTERLKHLSKTQAQTSTDSEDLPAACAAPSRDTPRGFSGDAKQHRKSAKDSRKKLFSSNAADPDKQQSANEIKACHSPNLNNNRHESGGSFQRGTQMRRSCSDLDPPYLNKAHSELDRFFDQMGLTESVLRRMDAYLSPTESEAFHPMHEIKYYDSDSMYSNDSDNLSHGSKISDEGLRRHLTSRLPDQSTSIVMRNARVIKWLCQCRKARTQSVS